MTNQLTYTPAVNRLLQLAANMYDATTNRYYSPDFSLAFPTVFRPFFWVTNVNGLFTNVYIKGYVEVTNLASQNPINQAEVPYDLQYNGPAAFNNFTQLNPGGVNSGLNYYINVFGVPWIIGAKKGFPNFNEFSMQTFSEITRKLQIHRSSIDTNVSPTWTTNMMYIVGISNLFGVEAWNSYSSSYTNRPVDIYVTNYLTMVLTNDYRGIARENQPGFWRVFLHQRLAGL